MLVANGFRLINLSPRFKERDLATLLLEHLDLASKPEQFGGGRSRPRLD